MTSRVIAVSYTGWHHALRALMAASALLLSGCSMDLPSKMTPESIQLVTDNHSQRYATSDLTAAEFDQIAEHYNRYGSGEAEVIVSYDPYSKKNTAMKATDQLHRISTELSKRGVRGLKSSILAVDRSGDQSEMVIGYSRVTAQAPDGCEMMPGYETGRAEADTATDYQMGCSVKTMVSRQIAHPEDLAGRVADTPGDGRRAGVVVETYRTGTPNDSLSGAYSSTGN